MLNPIWTDPAHDKVCVTWAREMAHKFDAEMERGKREEESRWKLRAWGSMGMLTVRFHPLLMRCSCVAKLGLLETGMDEHGRVIFGPNYERVLKFKKTYDPNVFTKSLFSVDY